MEELLKALYRFARNIESDCKIENCRKAAQRLASKVKELLEEEPGTFTRLWIFLNERGKRQKDEILNAFSQRLGFQPSFSKCYEGWYWEELSFKRKLRCAEVLPLYLEYKPCFSEFSLKIHHLDKGDELIEWNGEKERIVLW